MGPSVGKGNERFEQACQNPFDVLANILVGESERRVPPKFVQAISTLVPHGIVSVAVDFHDQRFLRTEEINDAVSNHVLPTEFESSELRSANVPPKLRFEWTAVLAEMTCSAEQMRILRHDTPPPLPLP